MANVCFLLAAIAKDLIVLRFCLLAAYICLFFNSLFGLPFFLTVIRPNAPASLDGMLWALLISSFHVYALYRFISDEREVVIPDEFKYIWRFFYRRSGMLPLEFQHIVDYGKIVQFRAGDFIADRQIHEEYIFLVIRGVVANNYGIGAVVAATATAATTTITTTTTCGAARSSHSIDKFSGDLLDMHLLGVFGVRIAPQVLLQLTSVAKTDCTLLSIPFAAIIQGSHSMATTNAWKNLLLYEVASDRGMLLRQDGLLYSSSGTEERTGLKDGSAISYDFDELSAAELQEFGHSKESLCRRVGRLFSHVALSLRPCIPSGVRHTAPRPLHSVKLQREIIFRPAPPSFIPMSSYSSLNNVDVSIGSRIYDGEPPIEESIA